MRKAQLAALSGLISLMAAASSSQAAIIPALTGTPTVDGANFDWTYDATIGTDFRVKAGDFFTIYDFGTVLSHSQPANWVFTSSLVGVNPLLILPDDNPSLANVTFTYAGPTQIIGAADLGDFILTINSNATTDDVAYAAQATRNGGTQDGRFGSDYGTLTGPAAPSNAPFIPEPASFCLLSLAAPAILRRRHRVI
ncbi:MAG TPA: hypothetical protein VFE58_18845 [Tepidisphaeraceae bacterium]|jgi:hypothetical protein|nr:hypothetical protein [Tepidisphaeraceae bacterium]